MAEATRKPAEKKTDDVDPRTVRPLDQVLVTDVEAYDHDVVAMVSRDRNGKPDQTPNYEIVETVPTFERAKAENKTDENNGA